ncbi:hypothetical protein D3C87_1057350 [compost metagenome]
MEKVKILDGYKYGAYILYKVEPEGVINYGGTHSFLGFDYAYLAMQWNISMETLELISSYDLQFKAAMYINYKERPTGQEKTKIIHADVLPALVRKLNETGQAPELDLNKELNLIHRLIRMVEESEEVQ